MTFRSIVIPIKAIVLNLLSVGAAYGVLVLVFQHGIGASLLGVHHADGVIVWLPLFLFVILFGLSMDYHVFILSRIREAVQGGMTTDEAVAHGIKTTAGTVTSAAIVMIAVFGIFATLGALDFKQMGIGLATAILIDATIVRGVLLPAAMKLLGEWNWYLPSPLGRLFHFAREQVEPARLGLDVRDLTGADLTARVESHGCSREGDRLDTQGFPGLAARNRRSRAAGARSGTGGSADGVDGDTRPVQPAGGLDVARGYGEPSDRGLGEPGPLESLHRGPAQPQRDHVLDFGLARHPLRARGCGAGRLPAPLRPRVLGDRGRRQIPPAPPAPVLTSVGHTGRYLTATWTLGAGTENYYIEPATSPDMSSDGFDDWVWVDYQLDPTQTTYTSPEQLDPGFYHVHVAAYDPLVPN